MANDVFANGREISCKAGSGKSIAAFPDVCFTPPENPATPPGTPVPYPNTGMASDTTSGSKKVKISRKEVMLKNKSHFKKSVGDEAGCAAKKGVVTSTNRGKVYFNAWSMDVKIEGKNAVRHLDLTTHNHRSVPGNTVTWPYVDRMAMAKGLKACEDEVAATEDACADRMTEDGQVKCPSRGEGQSFMHYAIEVEQDPCERAARCLFSPYKESERTCCPPQTPHHLVPKAGFCPEKWGDDRLPGCGDYDDGSAPCVCAEGWSWHQGSHGLLHTAQKDRLIDRFGSVGKSDRWSFRDAVWDGAGAMKEVFPQCSEECTRAQLYRGHRRMGITASTDVRPIAEGLKDASPLQKVWDWLRETLSRQNSVGSTSTMMNL